MRAILTRVKSASVTIEGRVNGKIGRGFLILLGVGPYRSVCSFSRFILGLENQAHQKSRDDGGGDAAGGGFQAAGEDPQEAILVDGFCDALAQQIPEARQGNRGPGTGEFCKRFV